MSDRFSIPPEYDKLKKRITDAIEPALQQKVKLKTEVAEAPVSLSAIISRYEEQLPVFTPIILPNISDHDNDVFQLEKLLQDSLELWGKSKKSIERLLQAFDESMDYAQQKLLSDDSPLKEWGKYGWTISPHAKIIDYYIVPASKDEADHYMNKIHNDSTTKGIIQRLKNCECHTLKDIDDIESLYNKKHYKACALMLFTLIDSLLIHTQDGTKYDVNRKQGNHAIEHFMEIAKPEDCQQFTTRVLCFIASTEALKAFFEETPNFQNNNPVLNRHLACHGMLQREVNKTDCTQLILLYDNMLHSIGEV